MIRKATAADLRYLMTVAAEDGLTPYLDVDLSTIADGPWTKVLWHEDTPVCAGGLDDQGHGTALAWAVIGALPKRLITRACRIYQATLDTAPFHWIEVHVTPGFQKSERFIKLLGFKPVGNGIVINSIAFNRYVYRR